MGGCWGRCCPLACMACLLINDTDLSLSLPSRTIKYSLIMFRFYSVFFLNLVSFHIHAVFFHYILLLFYFLLYEVFFLFLIFYRFLLLNSTKIRTFW